ncbi:MAG: hypothetical protein KZQ92_00420 [Candidatus Thiodiazotropha sp. (ex Lucinoma borealis)]|nr:hypothetical protein [Candidatus Thiodiazotropha sp. (ex Lucinoma borealis)]
MSELSQKLDDVREQMKISSDYIHEVELEIGQASPGQARTLTGGLNDARGELAELVRKETILLELENE